VSGVNAQVDSYVLGTSGALAIAVARSASKIIDVVGDCVDGFPNAGIQSLSDGLIPNLGIVIVPEGDFDKRSVEFGLDQLDGVTGGAHKYSPVGSGSTATTAYASTRTVGDSADTQNPQLGVSAPCAAGAMGRLQTLQSTRPASPI
jgi:hypothetical protein